MGKPLLSVIIVVYNGAATLRTAIASVLDQTCAGDIELVIIDGGSTDGTLDIIDSFAGRLGQWISEPDKGVFDAMNKGLRLAKGDWIYFLGCDDCLHDPQVLGSFKADLQSGSFDLVYGNIVIAKKNIPYDGEFTIEKLLQKNISHQAAFYHRNVFAGIGGFNTTYKAYADWDFNIRCFSDPAIRTKYRDRIVAIFGMDGISRRHDRVFLQEVLIPAKLKILARDGNSSLRRISAYDDWWRLIRNAGITSLQDLHGYDGAVPGCIKRMIKWQQKIPSAMLGAGPFSKFFMMSSYINNILTGCI